MSLGVIFLATSAMLGNFNNKIFQQPFYKFCSTPKRHETERGLLRNGDVRHTPGARIATASSTPQQEKLQIRLGARNCAIDQSSELAVSRR